MAVNEKVQMMDLILMVIQTVFNYKIEFHKEKQSKVILPWSGFDGIFIASFLTLLSQFLPTFPPWSLSVQPSVVQVKISYFFSWRLARPHVNDLNDSAMIAWHVSFTAIFIFNRELLVASGKLLETLWLDIWTLFMAEFLNF